MVSLLLTVVLLKMFQCLLTIATEAITHSMVHRFDQLQDQAAMVIMVYVPKDLIQKKFLLQLLLFTIYLRLLQLILQALLSKDREQLT